MSSFLLLNRNTAFITKGMPVGIIPFINDSTVITGKITQINPQVDENGMVKVKAEFQNNGRLIDGMNVKVVIKKPVPNRLVVPKEALVIRQGKDVIFVRQDSLAIWKYVTVEFENSTSLSIKEGLEPGDLVIISGNINLAHETIVERRMKEDSPHSSFLSTFTINILFVMLIIIGAAVIPLAFPSAQSYQVPALAHNKLVLARNSCPCC